MSEASLRAFHRWYSKPENKRKHADRVKKWALGHKTSRAADQARYKAANPVRYAWSRYRSNATKRSLEFSLAYEHFQDLTTDTCYYCTAAPNPINGVDRVDNSRGYVEDNVVTACPICNQAKHTLSKSDFETWGVRLGDNLRKWVQLQAS